MALPGNLTMRLVKGQYFDINGGVVAGTVTFSIDAIFSDAGALAVIVGSGAEIKATLDSEGKFSKAILTTDDTDLSPTGWRYRVVESFLNGLKGRTFYLDVPGNSTDPIDLSSVVLESTGTSGVTSSIPLAQKGAANGVAPLDGTSKIPLAYLPTGGATVTSAGITDATTVGRSVLTSATARAARVTLGSPSNAIVTLADLMSTNPFYVAHRGSGGEFPEHTLAAYASAVASGVKAIEVSVQCTADGVPVCMHDTTLDRTTNSTGLVADWTYSALREKVLVTQQSLLGPGWSSQRIPTLREVLDLFLGKVYIFLEAKGNNAVTPVEQMLTNYYPDANKCVSWKAYYQATTFAWAKTNGFHTWGYVDATTTAAQMDAVDSLIDMWGVPHTMTDANISLVIARPGAKPVMCWEVHRRSDVTRLTALGVKGLMCAQLLYVTRSTYIAKSDDFINAVKSPGDLPNAGYDPAQALKYDNDGGGGAYVATTPNQSNLMGRMCPTPASGYTIRFSMKFEAIPPATEHAGVAFGKLSDDVYKFGTANASGGYHVAFRANGDMQIYTHTAGVTAGTQLVTGPSTAPVANTWMSFTIQVTATQIIFSRTDVAATPVTATNSAYRGGYFHLSSGSVASSANKAHFKAVSWV